MFAEPEDSPEGPVTFMTFQDSSTVTGQSPLFVKCKVNSTSAPS